MMIDAIWCDVFIIVGLPGIISLKCSDLQNVEPACNRLELLTELQNLIDLKCMDVQCSIAIYVILI